MAKAPRSTFVCSECGWSTGRWVGRCGECQAFGTVHERGASPARASQRSTVPSAAAVPIASVDPAEASRALTGVGELDRVLGGGLVPGAVVLLAGEPGVGKSTLLLEVAAQWARAGRRTLYVSGEESAAQVRLRAERTGGLADDLYLAAETDLGTVLGHVEQVAPSLLVVDSVQTIGTDTTEGSPGGVSQVREVTGALVRAAKQRGMAVVVVGHVTKEGAIAGPRLLEHLVDVVLSFEGERHSGFRMVRATKNRFGPADEVGCFEMASAGIIEVTDPSGLFTSTHAEAVPGTCVTVTLEGRRPLLTEIQALVAPMPNPGGNPRRTTSGLDASRMAMVLAVLQRRLRLPLATAEVYLSTVGGARASDPSIDLAAAIAVASAARDRAVDVPAVSADRAGRLVALGEVGLAGELRRVPDLDRRLAEAERLGCNAAVVPAAPGETPGQVGRRGALRVLRATTLAEAIAAAGLTG